MGGMIVVDHGLKDTCAGACYDEDVWECMVCSDGTRDATTCEECLHGHDGHA